MAYDFDSGQEAHNALGLTGFPSDLGFGADEGLSASGDSGGPAFIDGAIAGVTSLGARLAAADIDGIENGGWGEASFDTSVSRFQEFIVDATDGRAVFVPEPSTWSLCATGAALLCCRRVRLRQVRRSR